jgi:hypothetical protein
MSSEFVVKITAKDRRMIGEADAGTHIYRQEGSAEECARWFDYISERFSPLVSPGGVYVYVPVSRAGVHKRLKAGKMTAFLFHITSRERTFWGKPRKLKAQPYGYIPVIECKAWAAEAASRPENFEAFLNDVRKDDWNQDFIDRDPRDKGRKDVRNSNDLTIKEVIDLLFG